MDIISTITVTIAPSETPKTEKRTGFLGLDVQKVTPKLLQHKDVREALNKTQNIAEIALALAEIARKNGQIEVLSAQQEIESAESVDQLEKALEKADSATDKEMELEKDLKKAEQKLSQIKKLTRIAGKIVRRGLITDIKRQARDFYKAQIVCFVEPASVLTKIAAQYFAKKVLDFEKKTIDRTEITTKLRYAVSLSCTKFGLLKNKALTKIEKKRSEPLKRLLIANLDKDFSILQRKYKSIYNNTRDQIIDIISQRSKPCYELTRKRNRGTEIPLDTKRKYTES